MARRVRLASGDPGGWYWPQGVVLRLRALPQAVQCGKRVQDHHLRGVGVTRQQHRRREQ
jgi:hypothetical protein